MTNFMFIVIVVIALTVIVLFGTVFGKQLRVKMKGRTDEVMRQDAQTPEGARDYYKYVYVEGDGTRVIELCGLDTDICVITNALIIKTLYPYR